MAARTAKQREQWKRFNALGQVTSLAAWIKTKRSYVAELDVPQDSKDYTDLLMCELITQLEQIASQAGWDRHKPTAGKRLYK